MAQWTVPVGDHTIGGWRNQALAPVLYPAVNEASGSINDATYIAPRLLPSEDTCILLLSPLAIPAAGTVTLHLRGGWGFLTPFFWSAVPTATHYFLRVGTEPGMGDVFWDNVGFTLTAELSLIPGTYYSRVEPWASAWPLTPGDEQMVTVP